MTLDPAAVGDRIEQLLEASAVSGPVAQERAEELVRLVVDLYGAGLQRILDLAYDGGALTDEVLTALAEDELVSSLLLVHGLHPYGVPQRVELALAGTDVSLVEVTSDGVARLALHGTGCGSSTLDPAVEAAVRDAAPELTAVEVVRAPEVIPVDSLLADLRTRTTLTVP